jgi:hypothetical protein
MRKSVVVFIALLGYSPTVASGPRPPQPARSTKPKTAGPCIGPVAEYCKTAGGKCPTFVERVEALKSYCEPSDLWRLSAERCVGTYRSLSMRNSLGSSDEYFDANGHLTAASVSSDYPAYCNGSSFSATFGSIPTCTTRFVTIDVCKKK